MIIRYVLKTIKMKIILRSSLVRHLEYKKWLYIWFIAVYTSYNGSGCGIMPTIVVAHLVTQRPPLILRFVQQSTLEISFWAFSIIVILVGSDSVKWSMKGWQILNFIWLKDFNITMTAKKDFWHKSSVATVPCKRKPLFSIQWKSNKFYISIIKIHTLNKPLSTISYTYI